MIIVLSLKQIISDCRVEFSLQLIFFLRKFFKLLQFRTLFKRMAQQKMDDEELQDTIAPARTKKKFRVNFEYFFIIFFAINMHGPV